MTQQKDDHDAPQSATSEPLPLIIEIEGWKLARLTGPEDEPRIFDLHLAEQLGYARAAKVRDLIKDMITSGKLNASEVFTRPGKTSEAGGRPSTEFWLTEEQALLVTTQREPRRTPAPWRASCST